MLIPDTILERLRRDGYAVVPNFLPAGELAAAQENFLQYFPTSEELLDKPQRFGTIYEDPEHLQVEFPFAGDALNHVSSHPDLIDLVTRLLGTDRILLSQAAIWAKYAGLGDYEQGLHLDYQGNTLVVPREDGDYRQVNAILYYSDVDETLAPTHVVSQEKTRNLPPWPTHRTRRKNPELYRHERPVFAAPGTLFLFGMNTWHRASAFTADTGHRFTHHFVFRAAAHGFQGYHHWPSRGENEDLQHFIAHTTPRQRELLGFPRPGDAYWTQQTLADVKLRYPQLDFSPYQSALGDAARRGV
jgi:hypothetical protein